MAPIVEGKFTSGDIDALFEVIHPSFRAAVLAATDLLAAGSPLSKRPGTVIGDFATYIGQSWVRIANNPESDLVYCKRVLICSEDLRDPALLPEVDDRNRVLRGLAQRLVNAEGLDSLTEAAKYFCTHPIEDWPLPLLDDDKAQRIHDLVAPIQPPNDYLLVLWRNHDGSPRFDYTSEKPERRT